MRKIPWFLLSLVLIFTPVTPAFASVLGTSSQDTNPQIPATSEGPGFILPDSPLFFLDQTKQIIRLALAFTPQAKAKVHATIAGERFAELRFMLDRNNEQGIETDLLGISQNMEGAAENIHDARLSGAEISQLAKSLNDNIKAKQRVLDGLSLQTNGQLRSWSLAVADSLALAKAEVEKALPPDLAANEMRDDATRTVVLGAKNNPVPTITPMPKSVISPGPASLK